MYIVLLYFFSVASVSFGEVPECPPREIVSPCSCFEDDYLTTVDCEGFKGLDRIIPVIKKTLSYNMSFGFWKSDLGDIPSDLFEGHQSIYMHFENCEISSFGDRPFTGLENFLKTIDIYGSIDKRKKDLKTFPLGHLKKLQYLAFQANDIVKLGNDWFAEGPESLKNLNLEANDIEELGDKAFASLVNVEQIWLGDNSFKTVSRSMFPNPANKLWLLEMSFNGIENLPLNMFEGFPVLTLVHLAGNKLKTIHENIWGRIWPQLEEVYMERNVGFVCDEEMKWIYKQKLPKKNFRGKCGSGNKLSGRDIDSLTLKDFE